MNKIDTNMINLIRILGIDMVNEAHSGHPGIVLGATPIIYTLYKNHLKVMPNDDKWLNRDRFILSAGHGSALLYAILCLAGYDISLNDLKKFRKIESIVPGHPEYNLTPGVDVSTGPLGQGVGNSVGIAIAEEYLRATFNLDKKNKYTKKELKIFDYYTYVLCSDGDLMEGVSNEALSLAGSLKLGKLIILYDSNNISLDGELPKAFNENVLKKYASMGWHVQEVTNGEDIDAIDRAITKAKKETLKPSLIKVDTIIGKYSINEGTNKVHGSPLTMEDIQEIRRKLNVNNEPFILNKEDIDYLKEFILKRNMPIYEKWNNDVKDYINNAPTDKRRWLIDYIKNDIEIDFDYDKFVDEATRDSNGKVMNLISNNSISFIGGSADLASSTKTYLINEPDFSADNRNGKNIWFGVREHGMGSILNGLALCNLRVFGSTFLTFSDYLKPAIRMSALMNLPVTYVFTHDSVNIGEDGPTHQPIEQLGMLRNIPNLEVFRPCDTKEVIGSWDYILKNKIPSAIILSRVTASIVENSDIKRVAYGGYIVKKEESKLSAIFISTGTDIKKALDLAEYFKTIGKGIRVVSMPNVNLFLKQTSIYQDQVVTKGYKTFVIEASNDNIWYRFVDSEEYLLNINNFGYSGTKDDVERKLEFDIDSLREKIERYL